MRTQASGAGRRNANMSTGETKVASKDLLISLMQIVTAHSHKMNRQGHISTATHTQSALTCILESQHIRLPSNFITHYFRVVNRPPRGA